MNESENSNPLISNECETNQTNNDLEKNKSNQGELIENTENTSIETDNQIKSQLTDDNNKLINNLIDEINDDNKIEEEIIEKENSNQEYQKRFSNAKVESIMHPKSHNPKVLAHQSYQLNDNVTKIEEEIRFELKETSDYILDSEEKFYFRKTYLISTNVPVNKNLEMNNEKFNNNESKPNNKKQEESLEKRVKFSVQKIIFEYPMGEELDDYKQKISSKIKKSKESNKVKNKKPANDDDLTESERIKLEEVRKQREAAEIAKKLEAEELERIRVSQKIDVDTNKKENTEKPSKLDKKGNKKEKEKKKSKKK